MKASKYIFIFIIAAFLGAGCSDDGGAGNGGINVDPEPDTGPSDGGGTDAGDTGGTADGGDTGGTADGGDACVPEDDLAFCARLGIECGEATAPDNCGEERTVDNCSSLTGGCAEPNTCGGGGQEGVCGCVPQSCEQLGVLCGPVANTCDSSAPEIMCDTYCVEEITGGVDYTCAIGSGVGKCWGDNGAGQLGVGLGNRSQQDNPKTISGFSGSTLTAISAGLTHTCVITASNRRVYCWGKNDNGQLGTGTTFSRESADSLLADNTSGMDGSADQAAVDGGATQVAVGHEHTCALVNGGVECWGHNRFAQVGDPALQVDEGINVAGARPVPGLTSGVQQIAAGGYHTCALLSDGRVKCWGRNRHGQTGDWPVELWTDETGTEHEVISFRGDTADIDDYFITGSPTFVKDASGNDLSNIVEIAAGESMSCAIDQTSRVFCWGAFGAGFACDDDVLIFGKKPGECVMSPQNAGVPVVHLDEATTTFTYGDCPTTGTCSVGTCNLTSGKCEGDGYNLKNVLTDEFVPAAVQVPQPEGLGAQLISVGVNHSCAIVQQASQSRTNIACWGFNGEGQLGDNTTNPWVNPVWIVSDFDGNIVRGENLALGRNHSCTQASDQNVKCWGSNTKGQIGNTSLGRDFTYKPYDVKLASQ